MEKNRNDWTYFFHDKAIFGRVKRNVVLEGLCDVEVAFAQTVGRHLGEIESVSPTVKMPRKLTI